MDERQWIHAIQKGNKKYLQDIAEKYYDDIYRFCAFQTGDRTEACDLAQETFLRFIRYVENYRDRNLKGYLLTIAMNVCRNYQVQKGREITAGTVRAERENDCPEDFMEWLPRSPELSEPEQHVIEADANGRLMQALLQLPEIQREAILLHYLQDMKYREISRMKGVSVSTVKSRVRQGMEKLQNILRREDFFDG